MTRRRLDPLDGVNLLDLVPLRLAEWRELEDRVVLLRPPPDVGPGRGLRRRLSWLMTPSRLRLDELGSYAWRKFDGIVTVREVVSEVRDTFGDRAEPAEERLGSFVRLLRKQRFLGYRGHDG